MVIREHFLENLVKEYVVKKKSMAVTITPSQRKSREYLILDQKLENNLKR